MGKQKMRWQKILSNSKILGLLKSILKGFVGDKKVPTKSGNPYHGDNGEFTTEADGGGKKKKLTPKEKRDAVKNAQKEKFQQAEKERQKAKKEEDERKAKEEAEKQAYKDKMDDFYNRKFEIKKKWKDEETRLNHYSEKRKVMRHQVDFPGMSEEECLKYAVDLVDKVDFKKVDAYFDKKGQLAVYEKETDIFVKFSKYGLVTMFKPRNIITDKIDKNYWDRAKKERR